MKKLVLSFAVLASVSLFSCGGNKAAEQAEEAAPEAVEVVEEEVVAVADSAAADTVAADTVAAPAAE